MHSVWQNDLPDLKLQTLVTVRGCEVKSLSSSNSSHTILVPLMVWNGEWCAFFQVTSFNDKVTSHDQLYTPDTYILL